MSKLTSILLLTLCTSACDTSVREPDDSTPDDSTPDDETPQDTTLPCEADLSFEVPAGDNIRTLALDDRHIYFAGGYDGAESIHRRSQTDGTTELLLEDLLPLGDGTTGGVRLLLDDDQLYLNRTSGFYGRLERVSNTGGTQPLIDGYDKSASFAVKDGVVFFAGSPNEPAPPAESSLYRIEPDGTRTVLLKRAKDVSAMLFDGDRLLMFAKGLGDHEEVHVLGSIGLDGSDLQILAEDVASRGTPGIRDGRVYWFQADPALHYDWEGSPTEVQSIALDGSDRRTEFVFPFPENTQLYPAWHDGWIALRAIENVQVDSAGPIKAYLAEHGSDPQFVGLDLDTNGGLTAPVFGPGRVAWAKQNDDGTWQVKMRCLAPVGSE